MAKDIIFFDSNILHTNDDVNQLLPESILKKYFYLGQIYFPYMVFEEIKKTKKERIKKQLDNLKGNRLLPHIYDNEELYKFDENIYLESLVKSITIEYTIIDLEDTNKMFEIRDLAINKLPPFEGKDKESDKGFKDAYILFTILEFLEQNQSVVYLITEDKQLQKACKTNDFIKTFESYEEYETSRLSYYEEEYFLGQLSAELDDEIKSSNIKKKYVTALNNVQLYIEKDTKKINVFCDYSTKELLEYEDINTSIKNKEDLINELKDSSSFEKTHDVIDGLSKYNDYTEKQEEALLDIFLSNNQVYLIASDEDIQRFFNFITRKKSYMNDEKWKEFKKHY